MESNVRDSQQCAYATNDFMNLLGKGKVKKHSTEVRRFRDLYLFYKGQLGDRADLEYVRIQLLSLIQLSIQLERMTPAIVEGQKVKVLGDHTVYMRDDPHTIIHITAQIERLLLRLGLDSVSLKKNHEQVGD